METNHLTAAETLVITPEQLLKHWQGHRALTKKVIEAFPEDKLFSYSIGEMRPFVQLVMEMIDLAEGGISGIANGSWSNPQQWRHVRGDVPASKKDLLKLWDEITARINSLWSTIPIERFQQTDKAFGIYEGPNFSNLLYFIDNEIHHRGQGYVYLRSLGIAPPAFWERA